jgi:hypothetical protein
MTMRYETAQRAGVALLVGAEAKQKIHKTLDRPRGKEYEIAMRCMVVEEGKHRLAIYRRGCLQVGISMIISNYQSQK